jgi:hypothetical protein
MDLRNPETRDALLLSAAVVLGVLVPPGLAVFGMPIAAAGIAGLAYRRRLANAAIAVALGVAGVALMGALDLVYMVPAVVVIVVAVVLLPRIDAQWIGLLLLSVLGVADAVHTNLVIIAEHLTPEKYVTQMVDAIAVPGSTAAQNADTITLLLTLLPMAYFASGLITATVTIAAIAWAAKRSGRVLRVPALEQLDLTPHVLWPFIVGVLAMAGSYGAFSYASTLRSVGLNLVLSTSVLFAMQGVGVFAGMLTRLGVKGIVRVLAWVALAMTSVLMPAASFLGLLDFWVNFRRLPRDGSTPPSPTTAMSDR